MTKEWRAFVCLRQTTYYYKLFQRKDRFYFKDKNTTHRNTIFFALFSARAGTLGRGHQHVVIVSDLCLKYKLNRLV